MALLIDGYNLLHVTGIFGRGNDLTALHRAREGLLRFLAASIEPAERAHTTIVFDAAGAPPGLPKTLAHDGITVHFARDYADADTMLEDLIAAHDSPRSLVVVSSDHRVQRAARRRRAKPIDSDRWYAELQAARAGRTTPPASAPQKPTGVLTDEEVAYWMGEFSQPPNDRAKPPDSSLPATDAENPFPDGYAEDLLDGDA
jgi:uncharacterized protein